MTKHEAVKNFFEVKVHELVGNALGFNYSPEEIETAAIIPQYADRNLRTFITGERERAWQ